LRLLSVQCYPRRRLSQRPKAAIKALELDNTLAQAHATLAYAEDTFHWDWRVAESEYKQAIDLNPSYAEARHWYSSYLGAMGRYSEAIAEGRKAESLEGSRKRGGQLGLVCPRSEGPPPPIERG
jgi:tetratricopeptide (TPR) repeat protein